MNEIDPAWLSAFDEQLRKLYFLSVEQAGLDALHLSCFTDLPPREAAIAYGEEYDLVRSDDVWFWGADYSGKL